MFTLEDFAEKCLGDKFLTSVGVIPAKERLQALEDEEKREKSIPMAPE